MNERGTRELKDIGLRCPQCGYEKMAATDSWCWKCGYFLGEDWVPR